tara:strand:- start:1582 stop:1842 length:261 start_codon:yes stop_codon:yes gene_type:complete
MKDVDENGVDRIHRFRAYSERFRQFSVAHEVYEDTLEYILHLRKERDEARREVCQFRSTSYPHDMKEVYEIADSRGWDCFKENTND